MTRSVAHDFDQIALGELAPKEALGVIRRHLDDAGQSFGQRVYVALKAVTVRRLSARRADDANAWIDVIRQSSALLKSRGDELLGERLLVLSDMTADWARTCKVHDLKSVLERPYITAILHALHAAGGQAKRAEIVAKVGVGDANFSRILGTIEGIGLVMRDKLKERTIRLTEEGMRVAAETLPRQVQHTLEFDPVIGTVVVNHEPVRVEKLDYWSGDADHGGWLVMTPAKIVCHAVTIKDHTPGHDNFHYDLTSLNTGIVHLGLADSQAEAVQLAKGHNVGPLQAQRPGRVAPGEAMSGYARKISFYGGKD